MANSSVKRTFYKGHHSFHREKGNQNLILEIKRENFGNQTLILEIKRTNFGNQNLILEIKRENFGNQTDKF